MSKQATDTASFKERFAKMKDQQGGTSFSANVSCTSGIISIEIIGGNTFSSNSRGGTSIDDFNCANCIGTSSEPDLDLAIYSNPSVFAWNDGTGSGSVFVFYGGGTEGFSAYLSVGSNLSANDVTWSCWSAD